LCYQKRLSLLSIDGDNTEKYHKFVIEPDFIILCNYLFYEVKVEPNLLLESMMDLCFHEIALTYPKFLSILPLD